MWILAGLTALTIFLRRRPGGTVTALLVAALAASLAQAIVLSALPAFGRETSASILGSRSTRPRRKRRHCLRHDPHDKARSGVMPKRRPERESDCPFPQRQPPAPEPGQPAQARHKPHRREHHPQE